MKRTLPLLALVSILLSFAPPAAADHCLGCSFTLPDTYCVSRNIGRTECQDFDGTCMTSGDSCNHSLASMPPLAADFYVASVERLDDVPRPSQNETLIAAAEAARPATR